MPRPVAHARCRGVRNARVAVDWFNTRRLLGPIGGIPSAECEAHDYDRIRLIAPGLPRPETADSRRIAVP